MLPQGNRVPEDRDLRRRGSVGGALIVAVLLALLAAPLFAVCAKALYAGIVAAEADTILQASATAAFPALSLARLGEGIGEADMEAFRALLEAEALANADGGPLRERIVGVEAELIGEGTVACALLYRPGTLGDGFLGDAVPDPARVECRVDLPVEP